MGWQRTASAALVSATVSAIVTSVFWIGNGVEGARSRLPSLPVRSQSGAAPSPVAGATLIVPVVGVRAADLQDTYRQARDAGARLHDAIDIPAPAGTPVIAAAGGTVEKLFTSDAGGLTIYVRSPDGRTSHYYAHLLNYAPRLAEGQAVRTGQRLGSVGSTGNASPAGPHLHFAVHRMGSGDSWSGGQAVNPYPLLTGR